MTGSTWYIVRRAMSSANRDEWAREVTHRDGAEFRTDAQDAAVRDGGMVVCVELVPGYGLSLRGHAVVPPGASYHATWTPWDRMHEAQLHEVKEACGRILRDAGVNIAAREVNR